MSELREIRRRMDSLCDRLSEMLDRDGLDLAVKEYFNLENEEIESLVIVGCTESGKTFSVRPAPISEFSAEIAQDLESAAKLIREARAAYEEKRLKQQKTPPG